MILALLLLAQDDPSPKQIRTLVSLGHVAAAVRLFQEFQGRLPKTLQELVERPADARCWPDGGFIPGGKVPSDGWGRVFLYEGSGKEPKIVSFGADGQAGGSGENRDLTIEDVFSHRATAARKAACRARIKSLSLATEMYCVDWGKYPSGGILEVAAALRTPGPKKMAYFEFREGDFNDKGEIVDPWGRPLIYRRPGERRPNGFDLYSVGPDGQDDKGGGDDIGNW